MARKPDGGRSARHLFAFERRTEVDDGYGNPVSGDWLEEFRSRAVVMHQSGSESVQAARLEGRRVVGVYVRSSRASRDLTTDYRLRDLRRGGTVYAVRIVDATTDPRWVYLEAEEGVAA